MQTVAAFKTYEEDRNSKDNGFHQSLLSTGAFEKDIRKDIRKLNIF